MVLKKWILWKGDRGNFANMEMALVTAVIITKIPTKNKLTLGEIEIFKTEVRNTFPQAADHEFRAKKLAPHCFPDEDCWSFVWKSSKPIQMKNYEGWANSFPNEHSAPHTLGFLRRLKHILGAWAQ